MNTNTIHFETLGCRLNQDETEGAARSFSEAGFTVDLEPFTAQSPVQENIILGVVNTCTVTGKAEQKARRIIRLILEKCPNAAVIVTGCYAEVDAENIRSICMERIAVLPGTKKSMLSEVASHAQELQTDGMFSREKISLFFEKKDEATVSALNDAKKIALNAFSLYTPVFEKHSRASLKIEDGCNNACAFCRIHLARGAAVSLETAEVVTRVQELEEQGLNEVVFTGVNMSQYAGRTPEGTIASFPDLLDLLIENTKRISFRISSYYPQCIDEHFCEAIKSPRVQPSFHLSIQSGSNRILKLMNRPYTAETVLHAITMLRSVKEAPFIACDLIAGFPGETEADFADTKSLCEKAHFSWIHAFPFSPRPGTLAATMKPKIPERIKDERVSWLTECAIQGKIAYINSFKDTLLHGIVENSRSQRVSVLSANHAAETKMIHVVTENFIHVECPLIAQGMEGTETDGDLYRPGSIVQVSITRPLENNIRSGKEIEAEGHL